ncbi:MAG: Trk system potassium transporter TrkA [Acidobacteria bacterium]|nr:Trk system potassium transporter TrkA [Acidobacteriota bacterium]
MSANGHFCVMGIGDMGFHIAEAFGREGRSLTLIDLDPGMSERIEEELDAAFVVGNGAHQAILERANVDRAELFIAASSSEEANLVASVIARNLGAKRCVVRLDTSEDLTVYRRSYERLFGADLLLSPQSLATNAILNIVLGHHTHEVDYLARGRFELRTIQVQIGSTVARLPLSELPLPEDARIVGYFDGEHELSIPGPDLRASPGDLAMVLCRTQSTHEVEELFASRIEHPHTVAIAGGSPAAVAVVKALRNEVKRIRWIERDRRRAEFFAQSFPDVEVLHGDPIDAATMESEGLGRAEVLIAATSHDDSNVVAGLIAQELGVRRVVALIHHTTSRLWKRVGEVELVSPHSLAIDHVRNFVANGYKANLVTLADGAVQVVQRVIHEASPAAGATLADLQAPRGLIVGAVVRGDRVFMPERSNMLRPDDQVILFVHRSQTQMARLLFPGSESEVAS